MTSVRIARTVAIWCAAGSFALLASAAAQTTPPAAPTPSPAAQTPAAAPEPAKPDAAGLDKLKKVIGDMGYRINSSTDDSVTLGDKDDEYLVLLSDDKMDVYVSDWVDIPKDKEAKIPYRALLEHNDDGQEYYSIGKSKDGSLYLAVNYRIRMADFSAATLRGAIDAIAGNFDDNPELTDPEKWK